LLNDRGVLVWWYGKNILINQGVESEGGVAREEKVALAGVEGSEIGQASGGVGLWVYW
jgi:hypothetical protein